MYIPMNSYEPYQHNDPFSWTNTRKGMELAARRNAKKLGLPSLAGGNLGFLGGLGLSKLSYIGPYGIDTRHVRGGPITTLHPTQGKKFLKAALAASKTQHFGDTQRWFQRPGFIDRGSEYERPGFIQSFNY